jgi:hypothetical protein
MVFLVGKNQSSSNMLMLALLTCIYTSKEVLGQFILVLSSFKFT